MSDDQATDPADFDALERQLAGYQAEGGPPADWEARVWAAIARERPARARRAWLLAPLVGLAAAIVLLWPAAPDHTFALQVQRGAEVVRGLSAAPGDTLTVRAGAGEAAHVEVRVFRDDRVLIRRCVGAGACAVSLDAPGAYRALLIRGPRAPAAESAGLDADLAAARAAGAAVEISDAVDVR